MAYATERAKLLFGSYRRADANDPDTYVAAIAAVLAIYDAELIREVTDPRTGIQTAEKYLDYMPHAGQLKAYCDSVAARRDRIQKLGALPKPDFSLSRLPPPPPAPGDLATIFVPTNNPRYAALVEWSKAANPRLWKFGLSSDNRAGIWISHDTWDQRQVVGRRPGKAAVDPSRLALSEATLRAMTAVDAERSGNLPCDQPTADAAE